MPNWYGNFCRIDASDMIVCVHVYETNVESFFKVFIKTRLRSMTDIEIESPYPPLKKNLLSSYEEVFLPECFPLLIWLSCRDVSWMGSRLPLASCIWWLCEAGVERPGLFFPMQGTWHSGGQGVIGLHHSLTYVQSCFFLLPFT